jgi:hypothetical protein
MIQNEYSHSEENLRVVDTGKSKFKIVREADGTGLWHIETDTGPLPVALRDKKYTRHAYAYTDIKIYLDGHAERSVVYGTKKKKEE